MNKKQLSLQNSSLFAELERKTKEIEILNIRLEEAEQKIDTLCCENEALKQSLEKANSENKALFEKNKELEAALVEAKVKATTTFPVINSCEPETDFNNLNDKPNVGIVGPCEEEVYDNTPEITEMAENTETVDTAEQMGEAEEVDTPRSPADEPIFAEAEQTVTEVLTPPTTYEEDLEKTKATTDLLRDYGAKIIGKVTRVTAEVLSKISNVNDDVSESLKTLALGKNESFKFQIMTLAKKKGDTEKIMAEMDFLADEAIVYLRSI